MSEIVDAIIHISHVERMVGQVNDNTRREVEMILGSTTCQDALRNQASRLFLDLGTLTIAHFTGRELPSPAGNNPFLQSTLNILHAISPFQNEHTLDDLLDLPTESPTFPDILASLSEQAEDDELVAVDLTMKLEKVTTIMDQRGSVTVLDGDVALDQIAIGSESGVMIGMYNVTPPTTSVVSRQVPYYAAFDYGRSVEMLHSALSDMISLSKELRPQGT